MFLRILCPYMLIWMQIKVTEADEHKSKGQSLMTVIEPQSDYTSYLLRIWQTYSGGNLVWRASLESPHTGQRWSFAAPSDLFTFLEEEIHLNTHRQISSDESDTEAGQQE
jgi:hypothetical protein